MDTSIPLNPECATSNPTLIYDNLNPVQFTISGNVTISGVNLSGKTTLLSGCNTEKCMYCGVMTVAADGTGTDDQSIQHQSGTYVTSSACNTFMYFSFMILQPGAILSLLSLAISDFRQGLGSLFTMTSGFLTFKHVSFVNISTSAVINPSTLASYQFTNAIIQQNSTNSVLIFTPANTYEQGGILLDHVSVALLNNGYEISGALRQYGLLSVNGIKSVRIVNSTFTNIIIQNGSLLTVFAFLTFKIDNCVFDTIYMENYLFRLTPTGLMTLTPGPDNEPDEYYLDHVLITNTVFTHLSASVSNVTVPTSLLYLSILGAGLNVHMENLEFSHCEAVTWLLYIYHFVRVLSTTEMQGTVVTYTNSTTSFNMTVPKIWTRIKSVRFDSVFVGATLLQMTYLTNVEINNVTIVNSGDNAAGISTNDLTLKFMIGKPGVYLTQLLSNIQMPNCQTVVSILTCYNITILNSFFGNDTCNNGILGSNKFNSISTTGQGGIHTSSLTGNFSMTDVEMIDISGPSVGGGTALIIDTTGLISLKNVRIRSCTNYGSSGTGIATISPVAITKIRVIDCVFEDNSSQGAVLQIRNGGGLLMNSSVFKSNQSKNQATLYFIPGAGLTSVHVDITASQFVLNSGGDGTALYLTNIVMNPVVVNLQISSTTFQDNAGTGAGTAIFIDNKNALDKSSYVKNCDFLNNTASDGVVNVAFLSGALSIVGCTFKNNAGEMVAGISASQLPNTPKNPTFISISNSRFSGNAGISLIKLGNPNGYELLYSTANCFLNNGMQIFTIDKSIVFDTGSVYKNNAGSSYHATTMSQINITDSAFINGTGSGGGGAAYLGGGSVLNCTNCTFQGNSVAGYGGALYIEQDSVFTSVNSQFIRNYAGLRGAALYIFGSSANCSFTNTLFQENESGDSGTVAAISSSILFFNSTFLRNTATNTALISAYFSNTFLANSTVAEHWNLSGPLIYSALESQLYISGCVFTDVETSGSGGVIRALSSQLVITTSTFSNIRAFSGALLSSESESVFYISDSRVENATTISSFGGIISVNTGSGQISQTTFQTFTNSAISGISMISLILSMVNFLGKSYSDGSSAKGAALYCSGCTSISVDHSVFTSLSAVTGAAVYLSASTEQVAVTSSTFTSCEFVNLTSSEGAIYIYNGNAAFQTCNFEHCLALSSTDGSGGSGGAMSLYCPDLPGGCEVTIDSCEFVNNSATIQGGSIYWQDSKPIVHYSGFTGGSAFYGPDIASYPVGIHISAIEGNATIIVKSAANLTNDSEGVLLNIASGQIANQIITASLLDHYGQVVLTNTGTYATIGTSADNSSVTGTTTFSVANGTFTLAGFGITAPPETSTTIYVLANAISSGKHAAARDNLTYSDSVQLSAVMRACQIGESQVEFQCVVCPSGKYSLDPKKSCQDCNSAAICYGSYTMVPRDGYWRSNIYTDVFWACPYAPACIGSPEPPQKLVLTGGCAPGYFGNLCNGCLPGFSRHNQVECSECPSTAMNAAEISGIGVLVLLFLVLVVATAIRSAHKTQSYISIYIKILLNYLQLVMLTANFNLGWPTYVVELFQVQQNAGSVTDQVFSIDCFLTNTDSDAQANAVRTKIVILAILPIGLLLISFLIWLPVAIIRRKCAHLKNEMVTTCVACFFLVHPSIVKFMFDFLNCRELDPGEFWMSSYLNVRCWDSIHYRYAFAVALPSILVWGVGLPSLCLVYLMSFRHQLDLTTMKLRLGFIYNGYDRKKYFWELVILYRKVMIITIAVFFSNISVSVQALTVMLVILIALALQSKNKPYIVPDMNDLELKGILVGGITIYVGMYCLSQTLDTATQMVLFIVIVLSNAYFLIYWVIRVVTASIQVIVEKCPCLARLFRGKTYRVWFRSHNTSLPLSDISQVAQKEDISISKVRS